MEQNFSELIEYLDTRFTKIEKTLETKADKADVDVLINAIDASAKKEEIDIQEMASLSHKVDRHDKWLHQTAQKLEIKLEY